MYSMLHLSRRRRHGEPQAKRGTQDGRNARDRSHEAGFTLIELLVVMVILVLLASLVAPRVIGYLGSSRTKTAKVQISSLATSLELFKLDAGRYPDAREGLSALVQRPTGINAWNGPYLKTDRVPLDPWGQPYIYRVPGQRAAFDVISLGADKREGGGGEDQDVSTGD
ncbi:type II secretion system major pseudopilin GspG [Hyphomicrobium facile]|uniref:Type II secretion system core protein G n=1 Tax=Hyphomicrobium facile TaxID=51670 RepID=A0A1I7N4M3_9HYPH|nr:type II secretion system major pseudopilin GspG [Hyphomicrobium facile]SFV29609.1 general secretion pathway protein G [Hyphomicrobium facile]